MQKDYPYIIISFGVAIVFIFLTWFELYEGMENKLLDLRFLNRGKIETRNDIATLDMDSKSLQVVGRWPWSREKHVPSILAAKEHQMDALAFDIFFIERQERKLEYHDVTSINDSVLTLKEVKNLFPDPDIDLANAAADAKNIYFGYTFFPQPFKKMPVKKRTQIKEARLKILEEKGFFKKIDPDIFETINDFYDIDPPVDELIQSSKGTYFFQTVAENDGVSRRYPLVGKYENRLFPNAGLALALDHYGVSLEDVEIIPGKHLLIPLSSPDEYGRSSIRIPIDKRGLMQVNWAGKWEDEDGQYDFTHYPYWVLKKFRDSEYNNYVMSKVKELANTDPTLQGAKNLKALMKAALKAKFASKKEVIKTIKQLAMSGQMESYILRTSGFNTGNQFFESIGRKAKPPMINLYNEIKNSNTVAIELAVNQDVTLDELLRNNKLVYNPPIKDYTITSYNKLKEDVSSLSKSTKDEKYKKRLKRSLIEISQLERNFLIVQNLYNHRLIDQQLPLYFFPNSNRIVVGNPKKNTARRIVPFEFYNKKLIYGLTAAGTSDLGSQPFNGSYPMVGLHANALNTILSDIFITRTPKYIVSLILLLLAALLAFGIQKLSPAIGGASVGGLVLVYVIAAFWLFTNYNIWLDLFAPIATVGLGYLGITVYNYIQEEKNKQFLKSSFGTYISPELIDEMYESGQEPELGGEEGYHTAFFTDIQSFSAFSEKLSASDLVSLLNNYLTEMTDILMENNGTLDKYIGDAIVAFYGAPLDLKDHELMACRTAIKMQERLAVLREQWQAEGDRWPEIVHHMQNRIGINTGQMVTGNMGSDSRMNYTMMGDTVNLAARLESSAKQYGVYIQIADSTYESVKDQVVVRALDFVKVMGKEEPVKVFELISETGQEPEPYKKILPAFHEALGHYFNQDWDMAIAAFKAADELEEMFPGRKTNPSRIYIPRCEHFKVNPPGDDWDGVWTLTSK
ncbi:MAG: CHASE2 domain-containing protein [Candidatus Neomarinimicrobiota bacterium]|nr:CHASE2 domain-containing protein [Candidatus Neomarinimicrobiota bacterium]